MRKFEEKKGAVLYVEGKDPYDRNVQIGSQYVKKAALMNQFGKFPDRIRVTIEAAQE
jgi:hypothetical protein